MVDSMRIEQAVINLLDDTLRYTPIGGSITENVAVKRGPWKSW